MHFGENQLSRGLIGLSPLPTAHPPHFQLRRVRSSTRSYTCFNLAMGRSPRFGSAPRHWAPQIFFRTRCRYGSPTRVNLATRRRLAGSFFNRHAITPRPPDTPPEDAHKEALTARERPVSGTVSLPSRGTFHHSLTVLVRYRSSGGIQAAEWSRQIHTGFHGPRATGGRARAARRVPPTGLSPAAAPHPRGFGYPTGLMHCAPPRRRREERAPNNTAPATPAGYRTRTV